MAKSLIFAKHVCAIGLPPLTPITHRVPEDDNNPPGASQKDISNYVIPCIKPDPRDRSIRLVTCAHMLLASGSNFNVGTAPPPYVRGRVGPTSNVGNQNNRQIMT